MRALRSSARLFSAAILTAAFAFSFGPLSSTPAEAQVYYSIYGGYRNTPPAPYRDDRRSASPFSDFFGSLFGRSTYDDEEKKPDAFAHHCVRTCDGKFFPVSRGGRKDISLDKLCSAMCPAAQTKIFSGRGIDHATANDGQRYSAIPNAFAYRTKIVDNCSCNGRDPFGVVNVPLEEDLTLEGGDLVVRETGFNIYRGAKSFIPLEKSGLSPAFVKQFIAIKILPDNPHATFAKTMPVMTSVVGTTPPDANAPAAQPPN